MCVCILIPPPFALFRLSVSKWYFSPFQGRKKKKTKEKAETSVLSTLICTRFFKHGNIWSKRQLTPVKKLGSYCSLTSAQKTTITWGRFCKRDVLECSCRSVSSHAHVQGSGHWKCPFIMGQDFIYFYSFYSCNLPIAVLLNPV